MSKVDLKRDNEKRQKNKLGRKYKRDSKLQELERQLQFAESRCGTLKQQLDYIKLLYGCGKRTNVENHSLMEEGHGDGSDVRNLEYSDREDGRWNGDCGRREDGDCPEYIKKTPSHSNTTSTNSSNKQIHLKADHKKEEELKKKFHPKQKANFKLLKVKKKNCKKVKKRRRPEETPSSKVSNVSNTSQTQTQTWQDPVVEIYKNSALNVESEIGFEIFCKNKIKRPSEMALENKKHNKMSAKNSCSKESEEGGEKVAAGHDDGKIKSSNHLNAKKGMSCLKEEGMQTDHFIEINPVQSKRNDLTDFLNRESSMKTDSNFVEAVKSYCQPTISSKRKQVERDVYSNLTNINVRNIPFIAARSTAPSHNIGVNIQQVLSIMKKRQPMNENLGNSSNETGAQENPLIALINSKKTGGKANDSRPISEAGTAITCSSESRRRPEGIRSNMSHWRSNSEINKEKQQVTVNERVIEENEYHDWSFKVDKLKKVLVFLHEDFKTLSQKYKRLQKKLTKRNITKTDAKDELADIERELEKKEQEITVVIALYKEVLNLREDFKKLQEKYNLVASGRTFMFDGLRQSNSTHTQMTALLRKIQNFQDQLKG